MTLKRSVEKQEKARRRGVLLIIGAGTVLLLGYGAWWVATRTTPKEELGVEDLVRGKVTRREDGRCDILYDFDALPVPEGAEPEFDRYPQLRDWEWPAGSGVAEGQDRFVGKLKSFIVFEGDVAVKVEVEFLRGAVVNARLCMTTLSGKTNYYQLSVLANGMAVMSEVILGSYQDIARVEDAFPRVKAGEKHTLRFDLEGSPPVPDGFRMYEVFEKVDLPPGGTLKAYLDGKLILTAEATGRIPAFGTVGLGAWNSRAFFDDLRITGLPTRDWIEKKRDLVEKLGGEE